ncbi:MAG: peptide chain release factor N(5)-glutamine methyltransferase [Clostridia bacterium]|nr:peptide chain release factor N(5)-glutamine methyltransferase [Clostridia bacterium]
MKYNDIVNELNSYIIENSDIEAEIILNHLFGVNKANIIFDREREYEDEKIKSILEKRRQHIPLQHIIGKWYFMGREFYVSPDTLIPRPDTEILVENALRELKSGGSVADLCAGSGCIGISMLVYREDISSMLLCDISKNALNIAKKNAIANTVSGKCTFLCGDITRDLPNTKFDMIVSNPPYIPSKDIAFLSDEVKKEPMIALDGGEDGLDIIRFLIGEGLSYLNENGKMLIEFGYDQSEIMDTLLDKKQKEGKIKHYEIIKDYGGNDRVALIIV